MSQILSGLILTQLQASNPDPFFVAQQKQLADAIAVAVQTYLITNTTVLGTVTPAGTVVSKITAP